ncbi:hypothetical protein ACLOJK_036189 [Asimina triloba]
MNGDSSSPRRTEPSNGREKIAVMSQLKKACLSFAASLQEGFRHVKASVAGLAKKVTAKNEKEASEADLRAAKLQVEASDEAERTKKQLES